ncbi:MAG: nicotinate (nicotinamide) nucleotide adenylyltransferase [Bacilli bacterium]|nr:nicotinate (nicotinamide) nucleotide adenylyltransferase [Bacilli bacterium]
MKLGIYIGSFNPPHIGHLDVVKYLLNNKYIDKVLIVPTSNYWNKNNLIDINDRINMLKTFENDKIKVDTIHNNYPYTYELMRALKHELDDELYLILGADNIIDFDKWKEYKELLQYKIIVVNRNNIDIKKYIKKYNSNNFIIVNDYNNLNVSSTLIRNNISKKYLTKEVFNYIKNNHLYEE